MLSEEPKVHPPVCCLRLRRRPVMMKHMKSQDQSKRYLSTILILMPHNQSNSMCHVCMSYNESLKMDWTVNDALYHRFLKWKLKCENILECKLAALPECQKCKKVMAWSSDFGMDQYVSWRLSKEEMNLDTIWKRFEDFCKPQSNEVWAQFDLLTSFPQGNKSIDEWYNAVQAQVNLTKYPPETVKILHCNIFWFFLCDEDFVSRTITEGSVDLERFPASRVH